jgi:outer membrane murein-binding lipoprotein Lpp
MTSIKKPLIAIASAIALVGTAIIAGPANAATTALTVNSVAVTTAPSTAVNAVVLPVPSDNSVDLGDALKVSLTGIAAGTNVVIGTTNAKVVSSVTSGSSVVKADAGVNALTIATGTGTTADFYVYTTTTANGSFAVTADNVTTTYFVKGTAGPSYNLSVLAPTSINVSGTSDISATVTDVFNNPVTDASVSTTAIGASVSALVYNSVSKQYEAKVTAPAKAGAALISQTIVATAVSGLPNPVKEVVSSVSIVNLSSQVSVLEAENATLKAKVSTLEADKTALESDLAKEERVSNWYKKKYNYLGSRWNNKIPGTKWDVSFIK